MHIAHCMYSVSNFRGWQIFVKRHYRLWHVRKRVPPLLYTSTRGLQGDVVYLGGWPIAPLVYEPKSGGKGGSCGVSAHENSCAHHVTWSPMNFGDITPIFNLRHPQIHSHPQHCTLPLVSWLHILIASVTSWDALASTFLYGGDIYIHSLLISV
jgi:hypothetical protein